MRESFCQKDSLTTNIRFELWLITLLWFVQGFLKQKLPISSQFNNLGWHRVEFQNIIVPFLRYLLAISDLQARRFTYLLSSILSVASRKHDFDSTILSKHQWIFQYAPNCSYWLFCPPCSNCCRIPLILYQELWSKFFYKIDSLFWLKFESCVRLKKIITVL